MISREHYRPDIDGLRAVSVLAVILFHFFPDLLPGGYAGVDVFFVISGFLVTKTILSDLEAGNFSFVDFYSRRIRRIVPAIIPVFVVCLIVAAAFTLSEDLSEQAQAVLYSAGMIQNHALLIESDYFSRLSELDPLLHFWSLSIEEQFYLFWPFVVVMSFRKWQGLPVIILLLSFTLNIFLVRIDKTLAFYILVTRMWELSAGALLCFVGTRKIPVPPAVLSLSSIILLSGSFLFLREDHFYPGYLALFPVAGTMFFILSGNSPINRFFSGEILVYTGLISYPLYLWHWPVLSYFKFLFPETLSTPDLIALIIVSVLLAHLTYQLLERPMRILPERMAAKYLVSALAFVALIAGMVAYKKGFPGLHGKAENAAQLLEDYPGDENLVPDFCHNQGIYICNLSDPERKPTVALIGDSHAKHLYPGFREYFSSKSENLLLMAQQRTPPFDGVKTEFPGYTDMSQIFRIILNEPSIHTVILSAYWPVYANEHAVQVGHENLKVRISGPFEVKKQSRTFGLLLAETVKKLHLAGKKIVFVHDIPTVIFEVRKSMPRPFFEESYFFCAFEENLCTFPYERVKKDQLAYREVIRKIRNLFGFMTILDPLPFFCDDKTGICLMSPSGKMIYWDEHHLNQDGSAYLAQKLFNP